MIELRGVTKEYRGSGGAFAEPVRALAGVSLRIEPGEAVGLIGLNGAGKSTLLRVLLGYARPTAGEVGIEGEPPRRYAEQHGVAYVPERVAIPRGWTVRGALRAYAALAGLGADTDARISGAMDRLGLEPLAERRIGALSKGNLQRVAIAQALLAERDLMILDEPTDGLDPVWVAKLRAIVGDWRAADPRRIVVLASHNLAEVAHVATRVVVLHRGAVRAEMQRPQDDWSLERSFLRLAKEWESEVAS
jgi:ABC-type multidrug transport system ATPase subunit